MAEVAVAPETEVTPPEDVALTTPDSTPEQAPESDNQTDETSFVDDILKGLDSEGTSTGVEDGKGPSTDGQVPVAAAPKTEAEIRQQVEVEQKQQQEAANLRAYRDGVTRSFQAIDADLTQMAKEWGLDIDQADRLKQRVQQHNGHWNVLYQAAIEQARPQIVNEVGTEMQRTVAGLVYDGVAEELGDAAVKALQAGDVKTWPDFTKAIVKEARKGYVSKEAAVAAAKEAAAKRDARLDEALATRAAQGILTHSIKDIDGNGHTSVPAPQGGGGSLPSFDAFNRMDITEQEKFTPEQRSRIYASDAAKRARG